MRLITIFVVLVISSLIFFSGVSANVITEVSKDIVCNSSAYEGDSQRWTCTPGDLLDETVTTDTWCDYTLSTNNIMLGKLPIAVDATNYNNFFWSCKHSAYRATNGHYYQLQSCAVGGNSYMTYDLGQEYIVGHIEIAKMRTTNVSIEVSNDGENWRHLGNATPYYNYWLLTKSSLDVLPGDSFRYIRFNFAIGDDYDNIKEIYLYPYDVECYTNETVVYESFNDYDEVRKNLKRSRDNIALGKPTWGDGSNAPAATDGKIQTSWRHENSFSNTYWFNYDYEEYDTNSLENIIYDLDIPAGPALYIDLEESYDISRVVFDPQVSDSTAPNSRTTPTPVDYYIGLSEDLEKWIWVASGTLTHASNKITHNIPAGLEGRYICLEMVPQELTGVYSVQGIDELEVYPYLGVQRHKSDILAPSLYVDEYIKTLELSHPQTVTVTTEDAKTKITSVEIDIEGVQYPMMPQGDGKYTYSWIPTTTGDVDVYVYSYDLHKNQAKANLSFTVVDTIAPEIVGTISKEYVKLGENITISITSQDSGTGVDFINIETEDAINSMNHVGDGIYTFTWQVSWDGNHSAIVSSYDLAGNVNELVFDYEVEVPCEPGIRQLLSDSGPRYPHLEHDNPIWGLYKMCSSPVPQTIKEALFDGDLQTTGAFSLCRDGVHCYPENIVIDLGRTHDVHEIDIRTHHENYYDSYTGDFNVSLSIDGENYTQIARFENGELIEGDVTFTQDGARWKYLRNCYRSIGEHPQRITLNDPMEARYIKIHVDSFIRAGGSLIFAHYSDFFATGECIG